jgi:hypothetical protein
MMLDLTGKRFGRLTVLERCQGQKPIRWICRCDCGKIVEKPSANLQKGKTKSCGCIRIDGRFDPKELRDSELFGKYKKNAKDRGIPFDLTREEFVAFVDQECAYCGTLNSNSFRLKRGDCVSYNGVDRMNSDKGYTLGNCVPCCKHCNTAKMDRKLKEYVLWIKQSYDHLVSKGHI